LLQLEIVDKHKQSSEKQSEEVRNSMEERLRTASAQREEHLRKQLERLKEHVSTSQLYLLHTTYNFKHWNIFYLMQHVL
jgi:hypothetical protein